MKFFLLASVSALALVAKSADALQTFIDVTPGLTTFTATSAGTYQIDVYGAQGFPSEYFFGGQGLEVGVTYTLEAGESLKVGVGSGGGAPLFPSGGGGFGNGGGAAGGGGGSFVQGKNLLLVGGGGGGGAPYGAGGDASDVAGNGLGGAGGSGSLGGFDGAVSGGGGGGGGFRGSGGSGGPGYILGEFFYPLYFPGGAGGSAFPYLGGGGSGAGNDIGSAAGYGSSGGGGGYSGGYGGSYGGAGGGGSSIGAVTLGYHSGSGEVTIDQLTSVPEPTTWSLITIGIGLLGWMMRRRRYGRAA